MQSREAEETEFSDITVTSEFGFNGTVTIENPETNIIQNLAEPVPNFLDNKNTAYQYYLI